MKDWRRSPEPPSMMGGGWTRQDEQPPDATVQLVDSDVPARPPDSGATEAPESASAIAIGEFLRAKKKTPPESLQSLCKRILFRNVANVVDLGTMPFRLAKDMLEQMKPMQLMDMEQKSPHFMPKTEYIWRRHVLQEFPKVRKAVEAGDFDKPDGWRALYFEKVADREEFLAEIGSRTKERYATLSAQKQAIRAVITDQLVGKIFARRQPNAPLTQTKGSKLINRARGMTIKAPKNASKRVVLSTSPTAPATFMEKWVAEAESASRTAARRKNGPIPGAYATIPSPPSSSSVPPSRPPTATPAHRPPQSNAKTMSSPPLAATGDSSPTSLIRSSVEGMTFRLRTQPGGGPINFFGGGSSLGGGSTFKRSSQPKSIASVVTVTKRRAPDVVKEGQPRSNPASPSPGTQGVTDAEWPSGAESPSPVNMSGAQSPRSVREKMQSIDLFSSGSSSFRRRPDKRRRLEPCASVVTLTNKRVLSVSEGVGTSGGQSKRMIVEEISPRADAVQGDYGSQEGSSMDQMRPSAPSATSVTSAPQLRSLGSLKARLIPVSNDSSSMAPTHGTSGGIPAAASTSDSLHRSPKVTSEPAIPTASPSLHQQHSKQASHGHTGHHRPARSIFMPSSSVTSQIPKELLRVKQ
ncbi:hypothetical protein K437DRAFT_272900 [Tilletiaria anomala UBC 951]|uniref:Elongin-A n=1 Tax=Tilletiaria anomala (strain ATCC 24038 / CBS 436.72 / UBC 951) TaxID=1037660 RepID=A0A066WCE3_TILAU|nr:uncharacterized protein K437DRAFT_272900 [Tilletiaria anomala UBC 951]KDN51396.1 hypothetical protein K437DRAFT_272900 [Tilletiaria anomala UBC 951]